VPTIDPYFVIANYAEAALWNAIGVVFLVAAAAGQAPRRDRRWPRTLIVAAVLFIAFGWSDVVETRTGAWWRPWWLLAWKGLCVLSLLAVGLGYYRSRRSGRPP
jgi:hypothetical protein